VGTGSREQSARDDPERKIVSMRGLNLTVILCLQTITGCAGNDDELSPAEEAVGAELTLREDLNFSTAGSERHHASNATFRRVYDRVIRRRCLPCHASGEGYTVGRLDLSTRKEAITSLFGAIWLTGDSCQDQGPMIAPGDAAASLLFRKVDPDQPSPCESKMPKGAPPLTEAEADLIANWINEGAPLE